MEITDLPKFSTYRHLIEKGRVVSIGYDCETTELDWKFNHITEMAMLTQTIDGREIDSQQFKSRAPERILTSPEAAIITRKHVDEIYDPSLDPPSILVGKIKDYLDQAGQRLWDYLGDTLPDIVDGNPDQTQSVQTKRAKNPKELSYRIIPFQDEGGNLMDHVRLHDGAKKISYRSDERDYSYIDVNEAGQAPDEPIYWKEQKLYSNNYSFNGLSFDNRVWAAHNYRSNFPGIDVYYPESKQNGNMAVDIRTIFNVVHYCATDGETRPLIGRIYEAATNRLRQSANLEKIMEVNQRLQDAGINLPAGPLVSDGTRPNPRRGHQDPMYDIRMMNGMLAYCREFYPELVAHVEKSANLDYFRDFATNDVEHSPQSARPTHTSYPLRAIVVSTWTNNEKIYDIRPVIVLGTDEQHGRRKKLICVRADVDLDNYRYHGKAFDELSAQDIADMMAAQRGQPDAIFYEVHVKKNKGMVPIEWALAGGMTPHLTIGDYRARRNNFIRDRDRIDKVMEGYRRHKPVQIETDITPLPLPEQDIHLTYGDIKYGMVELNNGKKVLLPEIIQEMAQTTYNHLVNQILRTVKRILMPHPVDWCLDPDQPDEARGSFINQLSAANDYWDRRKKAIKHLDMYQKGHLDPVTLIDPEHSSLPFADAFDGNGVTEDNYNYLRLLHLFDRLTIKKQLHKIKDPTQAFEVQIKKKDTLTDTSVWQKIPFEKLAGMDAADLVRLKNDRRIRIEFEDNPNRPTYTFIIRTLMEEGFDHFLSDEERQYYRDEISLYTNGYPFIQDPEQQPCLTADKVLSQTEGLRQNYSVARPKLLARAGELGVYNALAEDVDAADDILHGIERHTLQQQKTNPLTAGILHEFGLNPFDGTALPHVQFQIDPDMSETFIVPGKHIDDPIDHDTFGHTCLILPGEPDELRTRAKQANSILIEEMNTGRIFHVADPVIHPLPNRVSNYDSLFAKADQSFIASGADPVEHGLIISAGQINPVSISPIQPTKNIQTLRIPQRQLMALKDPKLVNFNRNDPLTGLAMRKYDLKAYRNRPVRLRGIDHHDRLTGWEVEAVIHDHETWSLDDIKRRIASGSMDDAYAIEFGFNGVGHMKSKIAEWFGEYNEDRRDSDTDVLFIRLDPVENPVQYNPTHPPRAAYKYDISQIVEMDDKLDHVIGSGAGLNTQTPRL